MSLHCHLVEFWIGSDGPRQCYYSNAHLNMSFCSFLHPMFYDQTLPNSILTFLPGHLPQCYHKQSSPITSYKNGRVNHWSQKGQYDVWWFQNVLIGELTILVYGAITLPRSSLPNIFVHIVHYRRSY